MISAFRAMWWKEMREGARWAVIGLTAITLTYLARLWTFDVMLGDTQSVFVAGMITAAVYASAALIGIGQSIPESRGDRWGLLVHRPMTRSAIFAAKSLAGITLFVVAAGLPLVGLAVWVTIPGHLAAPFDRTLLLPAIGDIAGGIVFYFAAMLTGMRKARWVGSRAAGIGLALSCAATVLSVQAIGTALGAALIGVLILGTAAWGAFVAGGDYEMQPLLSRPLTAVSVGAGIGVLGIMISLFVALATQSRPEPRRDPRPVTSYGIASTGQIVKVTGLVTPGSPVDPKRMTITDLAGRVIPEYADSAGYSRLEKGMRKTTTLLLDSTDSPNGMSGYRSTQNAYTALRRNTVVELRGSEGSSVLGGAVLYFIPREHRIAVFDLRTKRQKGWVGPDGYSRLAAATPRRFAGFMRDEWHTGVTRSDLLFSDAVYRLDVISGRMTELFRAPDKGPLLAMAEAADNDEDEPRRYDAPPVFYAVATPHHFYVLAPDGKLLSTADRTAEDAEYTVAEVARPPERQGTGDAGTHTTFVRYYQTGVDSSSIVQYSDGNTKPVAQVAFPYESGTAVMLAIQEGPVSAIVTPLAYAAIGEISAGARGASGPTPFKWSMALLNIITAIVTGAVAHGIGRRNAYSPRRLWLWTTVGVLGGILGVLVMLSLVDRPAREACPACGELRVVNRQHCEHCGAPFAGPAQDGTEIFEFA